MRSTKHIALVVVFAVAMAWLESASVAYLRTLVHRIEPYQISPLPMGHSFDLTELVREGATIIMLIAVGWLAGKSWKSRLGCFLVAFGVWDIFYYLFLKIIVGWPHTLFDWDVLFLIPVPWWGPVLAPMLIAAVFILLGAMMTDSEFNGWRFNPSTISWGSHGLGIAIALFVFMENSISILLHGGARVHELLPAQFNWPLFCLALILMMLPIAEAGISHLKKR